MRARRATGGRVRLTGAALLLLALAACAGGRPYRCTDGSVVRASYQGLDSVRLRVAGATIEMPRVPSAWGNRYRRGDVSWFINGDEAILSRGVRVEGCRVTG